MKLLIQSQTSMVQPLKLVVVVVGGGGGGVGGGESNFISNFVGQVIAYNYPCWD